MSLWYAVGMLSSSYRFHGHGSLNYLFRNGKSARNSVLLVKSVENKRRQDSRASVIVGKKISKSAVVRNRIRRRVYEALRSHWDDIPAQRDFAVTILSVEMAIMPAKELESAVLGALYKAGLYSHPNAKHVF